MAYFLKYNDIIVSEFAGFGVVAAEMPSVPEHELTTKTINSRNGDIYFSGRDDSREITLTFNVRTTTAEDYEQTTFDLKNCFKTKDESPLYIGTEDQYINAIVQTYNLTDVFIAENSFYGEGEIKFLCVDPYFYKGDAKVYDELSEDELENEGDVATYPKISVEFPGNSTFLQVDSNNGSILLGSYPKVGVTDTPAEDKVLYDSCDSLSNWTSVGNIVDEGATGETLVVGEYNKIGDGQCLIPNITSTDAGWHGAAYRINLPKNVKNFSASAFVYFGANSFNVDDGSSGGGGSTSGDQYKVSCSVSLNIRSGRGTKYKKLGSIPSGKTVTVTDISSGWGKVTYNGKTGYCSMKYLKKVSSSTTSYTHKTTANLHLRSGRGTKYKIKLTIPKNTKLKVTDIQNGWGKTTYKSTSGYVKTTYLSKLTTSSAISIIGKDTDQNAKENTAGSAKLGLLEVYGFDSQNNKLFKCQLLDNNYYYRHTVPKAYIGSTKVLEDGTACNAPKTKKDKDGNSYKIGSGDSGNGWSDFYGYFCASRTDNAWSFNIHKQEKGQDGLYNATKKLDTKNLANDKYPTGDLAYLVVYMAGYSDYPVMNMGLDAVRVLDMTPETPEEFNEIIFEEGDVVDIDCENNTVKKNGENFMQHLDIGSVFFPLSPGKNDVSVAASCTDAISAAISFTEKFN